MESNGEVNTDGRCLGITIELKESDLVYYSGEKLSGYVKVDCSQTLPITGLELKVFGNACVHWVDKAGRFSQKSDVVHKAEEVYCDETFVLWGQGSKVRRPEVEELVAGRHLFPFTWTIPGTCPSSYEGPYGWVRYHALATVLQPSKTISSKISLTRIQEFVVIRTLDLNLEKGSDAEVTEERDMVLHTAFCRPGEVSCTLSLQRSGFVPGETIRPDVQIHNICPRKIKTSTLSLRQVVKFGVEGPHCRRMCSNIKTLRGGHVKPGRSHTWLNKGLPVPALVPSRLEGCQFIDVSYELQLFLDLQSHSITIVVPITVGTVPHSQFKLDSWNHRDAYFSKWMVNKKREVPSDVVRNQSRGLDDGNALLPKYRVYQVAPTSTKTVRLDTSPGERRRSTLITLSYSAQESIV